MNRSSCFVHNLALHLKPTKNWTHWFLLTSQFFCVDNAHHKSSTFKALPSPWSTTKPQPKYLTKPYLIIKPNRTSFISCLNLWIFSYHISNSHAKNFSPFIFNHFQSYWKHSGKPNTSSWKNNSVFIRLISPSRYFGPTSHSLIIFEEYEDFIPSFYSNPTINELSHAFAQISPKQKFALVWK